MIRINFKKSAQIVMFDGLILCLAVMFLSPVKVSVWIGTAISALGMGICFWAKRYVFTRKKFSIAGPYLYVRYPYLLGHFIFVFGLVVHVRSFMFLLVTVALLGVVYAIIIRYAEKIPYSNASADYILYRSSVPALIPQLLPFRPQDGGTKPDKIDLLSILVNDNYTELFRGLSVLVVLAASFVLIYTRNHVVAKLIAIGLIASLYCFRIFQEYQLNKRPGLFVKQEN